MKQGTKTGPVGSSEVIGGGRDDLLAAFVAVQPNAACSERLRRLTDEEWLTLAGRGRNHGVLPLMREALRRMTTPPQPPLQVAQAMEATYQDAARSGRAAFHQLAELVAAFNSARIPVVGLKGAYLANAIYGDPALRPMRDLDPMVRRADLEAAERVLGALGYTRDHSPRAEGEQGHHLPGFERDGAKTVELHWSINVFDAARGNTDPWRPVFAIDMDRIWSGVESARLGPIDLLTLSIEDMLAHLCIHVGFHHAFTRGLQSICDIDRLVRARAREIDWSQLGATARDWGAAKLVAVTLRLVNELLRTAVPVEALAETAWTERDEEVYPAIRAAVLRAPRRGGKEWFARRRVIDPWLLEVTGSPSRGDIVTIRRRRLERDAGAGTAITPPSPS
jgi:hypothetical protein